MLSKKNRLSREDVKKTLETGVFLRGRSLTARALPSPLTHIAVAVSKKVAKTAVVRNKTRRIIYKISKEHPYFNLIHHDVVFVVHNSSDVDLIKKDIETCILQLTKQRVGV